MTIIRTIVFFLGLLAFLFTVWLALQNRGSEKVIGSIVPAFFIATVGVLGTLLFSLRPETRSVEFPSQFVFHTETKHFFNCERFPRLDEYSGGLMTQLLVNEMLAANPALSKFKAGGTWSGKHVDDAQELFLDVLLRSVFDALGFAFGASWQPTIKRRNLPVAGYASSSAPKTEDGGVRYSLKELQEIFPDNKALRVQEVTLRRGIVLPPKSRMTAIASDGGREIKIENPFATMTIEVRAGAGVVGIGFFKQVCGFADQDEMDRDYWSQSYDVSLKADFSALRMGHPSMTAYKRWAETMFTEIQTKCDTEMKWQELRNNYQLYSTRPFQ